MALPRRSSISRTKPTPKTPPTATWVDDTGSPRADAASTIIAVASVMQKARTAFRRVIPSLTMPTRRRPNRNAPSAMIPPASASMNSGTCKAPACAGVRITSSGPATLPASPAPWAKPIITAANNRGWRRMRFMPGLPSPFAIA